MALIEEYFAMILEQMLLVLGGLMISFVATLGAIAFNSVAGTIDAKFTVITTLLGWAALLVYAYAFIETQSQVWIWAFLNEPVYVLQDDPHW